MAPHARVAELVDAHDSKSCSARSGGSIPSTGTSLRSRSGAKAARRSLGEGGRRNDVDLMRAVTPANFIGLTLFFLGCANAATWCDKDCVSLCQKDAAHGGIPADQCIANHQCSQYANRSCAGEAAVAARANRNRPSGNACGPLAIHFVDYNSCINYQHTVGWSNPEAQAFCGLLCGH